MSEENKKKTCEIMNEIWRLEQIINRNRRKVEELEKEMRELGYCRVSKLMLIKDVEEDISKVMYVL